MKSDRQGKADQRQKLTLIVLGIIFVAPVVGSWIVYNFTEVGRNESGSNHGELITPPRPLADLALTNPNARNEPYHLYGRWNIVYLVSDSCDEVCEHKLYIMRQIRLALGQDAHRLQRILIIYSQDGIGLTEIQSEAFPGQLQVAGTAQVLSEFKLTDTEWPVNLRRFYIIDPLGNLMLSYAEGTDPTGLIKDLKRLLKYSRIG